VAGTGVTNREERHLEGKELLSTMSKQPDITNPLDPLGTWRAARDAGLESWSRMMIDLVNSEAYSQATSQWLDTYLTFSQPFQRIIETTMTQVLAGLNMPTRAEVTNLAGRFTNVEMRLDDLDAKLDDVEHAVQPLPASKQAVDAKVEARLDKLDTRLDDLQRAIKALPTPEQTADTKVEARLDDLNTKLADIQHAIKATAAPKRPAAKAKEVRK
jgi:polyhydroxyalkanoic acid synthase PhaR subunit